MLPNHKIVSSREQRAISRCIKRDDKSPLVIATGITPCRRKRRHDDNDIDEWLMSRMERDVQLWLAEASDDEAEFGCNNHRSPASSGTPYIEKPFGNYVLPDEVAEFPSDDYVVSLALFDGDEMLFACSGIALPDGPISEMTRFVTSAELVRKFIAKRNEDDKLRVEVHLSDNRTIDGFLGLYDNDIAIVTSFGLIEVCPVDTAYDHQIDSFSDRVMGIRAFGRGFQSGMLMYHPLAVYSHYLDDTPSTISFGDLTEAALGASVLNDDDVFVGMLSQCDTEKSEASFLPVQKLRQRLEHFGIFREGGQDMNDAGSSRGATRDSRRRHSLPSDVSMIIPSGFMRKMKMLESLGYPTPPPLMLELNGALRNTFEEDFGEVSAWEGYSYSLMCRSGGNYVWQDLPRKVHTNVSRRAVSVVSFNGDKLFFACTGLLISWHERTRTRTRTSMGTRTRLRTRSVILTSASLVRTSADEEEIDRNLRIEVFLPPNQRVDGILELYHLNYNIAVISVDKHFLAARPENIFFSAQKSSKNVVAVGRDAAEGLLLAAKGEVSDKPRRVATELDCEDLQLSTCKIKKVGIGGPLISSDDGSFVGMNFYDDTDRTPFLPRSIIVDVLKRVDLPSQRGLNYPVNMMDDKPVKNNRWPVPEAYWYHPLLDEDFDPFRPYVGRVLQ